MRTFITGNSFWYIELRGNSFSITFGRIGAAGQTQHKEFDDEATARQEHDRAIAEKLKKGYRETTAKVAATPLVASLEEALVENPDDLAAHSAYADYLSEQGDPRGELIQVQLALEDEARKPAERKKLGEREAELLALHGRQWLGQAGRVLWGKWSGAGRPWRYSLARGWVDNVRLLPGPDEALEAVVNSPQMRLLRKLEVVYDMRHHPHGFYEWLEGPAAAVGLDPSRAWDLLHECNVLAALLRSPYLGNLRSLKVGFSDDDPDDLRHSTMVRPFDDCTADHVCALLEKCPRLEELHLNDSDGDLAPLFSSAALGGLRVFQVYYALGHTYPPRTTPAYPLSALAGNPALRNLHTLRFHPGRDATLDVEELRALLLSPNLPALKHLQLHMLADGDVGARAIVESGILCRLKVLDVAYGNMTDEGARLLADAPGVSGLELLNVSRNALTRAGVAALRRAGISVLAEGQHGRDDEDYLYEVDAE